MLWLGIARIVSIYVSSPIACSPAVWCSDSPASPLQREFLNFVTFAFKHSHLCHLRSKLAPISPNSFSPLLLLPSLQLHTCYFIRRIALASLPFPFFRSHAYTRTNLYLHPSRNSKLAYVKANTKRMMIWILVFGLHVGIIEYSREVSNYCPALSTKCVKIRSVMRRFGRFFRYGFYRLRIFNNLYSGFRRHQIRKIVFEFLNM